MTRAHSLPDHQTQLKNKGEQPDTTYAEEVPWLEVATFGGFLAEIEVGLIVSAGCVVVRLVCARFKRAWDALARGVYSF